MEQGRLIDQLLPLAPPELMADPGDGALRFVNELLESTLDALAAHIAILDERGTVIAVNRAWKRFAESNGAPPGDYGIGSNYVEVCRSATGDAASGARDVAEGLVDVLEGRRERFYLRYPCHGPDENRWFQIRVNRFLLAGVPRVVVAHENITETKEFEQRMLMEQVRFSHAVRLASLGEMAAGMAHELNQPLAAIANYANGCLRRLNAEGSAEHKVVAEGLEKIAEQAMRGGEIIKRMRAFARRGDVPSATTSVREIVDHVVELCQPEATRARAKIVDDLEPGLPPIVADRVQIEQVLANLVRNALEAMAGVVSPKRGVTIRARREGQDAVCIEVSDTGPGIDATIRSRLFEPFATTKPSGMGLGLSLSESMIAAHGGRLSLARSSASGTTFSVVLPRSPGGTATLESG